MIEIHQDDVLLESLKHNYAIWHFIRYQRTANIVNEIDGRHVLDTGCGIGLQDFLLMNKTVIGIDLNLENVKEAKRVGRLIEPTENAVCSFLVADLNFLPFRKTFDIILCTEVLEHLKDDKRAVDALLSLLKDNGFLLLSLPNSRRLPIGRLFGLTRRRYMHPLHLREYTISDACKVVKNFCVRIEKIYGIYLDFPPFIVARALFKILKTRRPLVPFRYHIYNELNGLYTRLWLPLERLFYRRAFYIVLVLRKLPTNERTYLLRNQNS